jgi:hypothetical protein
VRKGRGFGPVPFAYSHVTTAGGSPWPEPAMRMATGNTVVPLQALAVALPDPESLPIVDAVPPEGSEEMDRAMVRTARRPRLQRGGRDLTELGTVAVDGDVASGLALTRTTNEAAPTPRTHCGWNGNGEGGEKADKLTGFFTGLAMSANQGKAIGKAFTAELQRFRD